jgi:hypothetical protein
MHPLHRQLAAGMRAAGGSAVEPLTFTFNIASDGETLTIPCQNVGTFDAVLDWGDGSTSEITAYNDADLAHVYATAGEYDVTVTGAFDNIYFNAAGDRLKLIGMDGDGNSVLQTVSFAWRGCSNLTSFPLIDASYLEDFTRTWDGCSSLTSFPIIDTSSGLSFANAWLSCSSLTSFPPIDTSSATSFSNTWNGCSSLTSFPLIEIPSCLTFNNAWRNCSNLADFPANFFDSLIDAPVPNCFFNSWFGCTSLTAQSVINILTSIDTSGVSAPASGVDITIGYAGGDISAASTAITNLKSRGWTVTINGVLQ